MASFVLNREAPTPPPVESVSVTLSKDELRMLIEILGTAHYYVADHPYNELTYQLYGTLSDAGMAAFNWRYLCIAGKDKADFLP